MPTLIIDNVPLPLYDRIQDLAKTRHQTPAAAVLEVLESALSGTEPTYTAAPLPQAPFLTEEICAPCSIPWPKGEVVHAVLVPPPLPSPHDLPDEE
jgi:hypothetical protein